MSLVSTGLNTTAKHLKKKSEVEGIGGRVETDGNDPDLSALDHLMIQKM